MRTKTTYPVLLLGMASLLVACTEGGRQQLVQTRGAAVTAGGGTLGTNGAARVGLNPAPDGASKEYVLGSSGLPTIQQLQNCMNRYGYGNPDVTISPECHQIIVASMPGARVDEYMRPVGVWNYGNQSGTFAWRTNRNVASQLRRRYASTGSPYINYRNPALNQPGYRYCYEVPDSDCNGMNLRGAYDLAAMDYEYKQYLSPRSGGQRGTYQSARSGSPRTNTTQYVWTTPKQDSPKTSGGCCAGTMFGQNMKNLWNGLKASGMNLVGGLANTGANLAGSLVGSFMGTLGSLSAGVPRISVGAVPNLSVGRVGNLSAGRVGNLNAGNFGNLSLGGGVAGYRNQPMAPFFDAGFYNAYRGQNCDHPDTPGYALICCEIRDYEVADYHNCR